MKEELDSIRETALSEIASAHSADSIEKIRVKYLGRKGVLTEAFKKIGSVGPSERPEIGSLINAIKSELVNALDEKDRALSASAGPDEERIDITLPGVRTAPGACHPITKTVKEICDIFISLGFMVVEGPEIETEHYNFEALNIPLEHPSRDAFDTFYLRLTSEPVSRLSGLTGKPANGSASSPSLEPSRAMSRDRQTGKLLLRSHTSPVQARFMEKNKPPFSIIVPGKVFRPDATDASHSFMFHQVEGLAVGDNIRFSDLKGVLATFGKQMFGASARMRFRPSFFPFTEPSAEVDVSCIICGAKGERCSVCGGKGWLEILGAGMVNPKVFKAAGYDPEKVTGFAFGMGVERIAMLKYGINDIRLFFENDIRFLKQF